MCFDFLPVRVFYAKSIGNYNLAFTGWFDTNLFPMSRK